jgi:eukaryotic-like serine/threonine-protein kinase
MSASGDTRLAGRYRILRRLGAGGMATVFLAEDERLGRQVAVKRLHADSTDATVQRLEREARLGASLNHPNVVTVYDVHSDDEGALVVMEYVDGETLSAALRRGPLGPDRALDVVRSVASALDHVHGAGVVHRDVKPGNVLLGNDGGVKLVDLGIAHATEHTRLTLTGTVLGTASYMAPEQLEGERVGPAADTYALAAVAFEALSGRKARMGSSPVQVAHAIATDPPPDLRSVWPEATPETAAALSRGMARDPGARPRSAGELALELSEGLALSKPSAPVGTEATSAPPPPAAPPSGPARAEGGGGRPAPPITRHGRSARRRSAAAIAGVVALAIAIGAVLVVLLSDAGSDGAPTGGAGATGAAEAPGSSGDGAASSEPPEGEAEGTPTEAAPESEPLFATEGPGDPARGADLNEEGKALIDQGEPEQAVAVLQEAVQSFPEGTSDIQYAYALYNLGNALRLSGRPDEAVTVLERRLEIPNQRGVVRAELRRARAAAAG